MKILFTNIYSKYNAGDASILTVMLSEFKKAYKNASLSISTMENVETLATWEDIPLVSSFFYEAIYVTNNPVSRVVRSFYIYLCSLIWAIILRLMHVDLKILFSKRMYTFLEELKTADVIVGTGGGYLVGDNSVERLVTLVFHLHTFLIARILGKPVILYSQSIGPFPWKIQAWYTRFVLNMTQCIITREDISVKNLLQIGVRPNIIHRSVDAAFMFHSEKNINIEKIFNVYGLNKKSTIVMVTVKRMNQSIQRLYEQALASFLDELVLQDHIKVVFLPQSSSALHNDDDCLVIERIQDLMQHKEKSIFIHEALTHYEISTLFKNADFLISTRMHSAIFALTGNIPTIAIAYEHKTTGIMNDLGLGEWVIPLEDVTSTGLMKKFDQLQKEQMAYKNILKIALPAYIQKAKQTITVAKKIIDEYKIVE